MKKIVAFGNPLLDTIVFVANNRVLEKYNLPEDGSKEVSSEEMKNISEDIKHDLQNKTFIAGGCAQNSLRVLQWLAKKTHKACIFGSVGDDNDAFLIKKLMETDGVTTNYIIQPNYPTGKTISLVNGTKRSLVAHLGAAENLYLKDIKDNKTFFHCVQNADYVYIEGYFLTKREDAAKYILDYCNDQKKLVLFNISGEYVCDMVPETLKYFVDRSNIIFGNRREFIALAKIMFVDSLDELIELLLKITKNKSNIHKFGNMVIITDGSKPGECYYSNGSKYEFEIDQINKKDIKDTTGAGDAFVGGFLAGLCNEESVEYCTKLACHTAAEIIKQIGCSLPN